MFCLLKLNVIKFPLSFFTFEEWIKKRKNIPAECQRNVRMAVAIRKETLYRHKNAITVANARENRESVYKVQFAYLNFQKCDDLSLSLSPLSLFHIAVSPSNIHNVSCQWHAIYSKMLYNKITMLSWWISVSVLLLLFRKSIDIVDFFFLIVETWKH